MGFIEMLNKIKNWKYTRLIIAGVYIVFGLLNLWHGGFVRYIISFSFFLIAVFLLLKKPDHR
jgi:antibiotic biosynthesis monooxygenase (ABM) superfamily enzyme